MLAVTSVIKLFIYYFTPGGKSRKNWVSLKNLSETPDYTDTENDYTD